MNRAAEICSPVQPRTIPGAGLHLLLILPLLFVCLAISPRAHAHKPSDSYLTLGVDGNSVTGRWDIALRDLDFAIGLDVNGDGRITWGELRARHGDVASFALARLALAADGKRCDLRASRHLVDVHTDGAYEVLYFTGNCTSAPRMLRVDYHLFFDLDPQHKGLLKLEANGVTRAAIFGVSTEGQQFDLSQVSRVTQFLDYAREGIFHIWAGFDHILFLLSLLLPAVLVRRDRQWHPVPELRPAFLEVFKVVTAFTLAHSITLSLATLQILTPPSRWVESAIAASVLFAALSNICVLAARHRWVIAFIFGLIHGFGFASVLSDLGLPRGVLLLGLVGFNLGVEAGQLVIVACFLPIAFALRSTWLYRRATLVGGSIAIALIAALWLTERAFDIRL